MSKPELLCIGHRGAMGHAMENTLASVEAALRLGTPCIEIDVQNVDGKLIVIHDLRLERTTNGHGYLSSLSFAELRRLNAGGGQQIPLLAEVCDLVRSRACLNIEIKGAGVAGPLAAFLGNLSSSGWDSGTFLVSSFNHLELAEFRSRMPKIKLGALCYGIPQNGTVFATQLGAFSVHLSMEFIDQCFVEDAHMRGLQVYGYTVNDNVDLQLALSLGLDGVFSDFPEIVIQNCSQASIAKWFTNHPSVTDKAGKTD
jgi:glycerophosphoryl diester phosphodiesterase